MSTVVITGSARGFGFQQAKKFKELGFNVVISDVNLDNLQKAYDELDKINSENTKVLKVKCDVTNYEDLENLYKEAKDNFKAVDIWINNAGVNQPDKPVYELSQKEIDFMLNIDLKGAIYGSNDAMMTGLSIYGTTKRAITYFTLALAKESEELTGGKVKVCRLTPGIMITDFIKTANGGSTHIELPEKTKKVYNILGDYPETIVNYSVPRMIKNKKNNARIMWLTNRRAFRRFLFAGFNKRDFFKDTDK